MAIRTSEPAVRQIIKTGLTAPEINVFIADASLWVDEELSVVTPALSDARLEVIERWLTAALIRTRDLGLANTTLEDVSEKYQVDSEVTDYLLRAASMDPTGAVRRHFLAAKPTMAPVNVIARVGPGFVEEAGETS